MKNAYPVWKTHNDVIPTIRRVKIYHCHPNSTRPFPAPYECWLEKAFFLASWWREFSEAESLETEVYAYKHYETLMNRKIFLFIKLCTRGTIYAIDDFWPNFPSFKKRKETKRSKKPTDWLDRRQTSNAKDMESTRETGMDRRSKINVEKSWNEFG